MSQFAWPRKPSSNGGSSRSKPSVALEPRSREPLPDEIPLGPPVVRLPGFHAKAVSPTPAEAQAKIWARLVDARDKSRELSRRIAARPTNSFQPGNKRPCSPGASPSAHKKSRLGNGEASNNVQESSGGGQLEVNTKGLGPHRSMDMAITRPGPHPLPLAQSALHGDGMGIDAASSFTHSMPASAPPTPAVIQTGDAVDQQRLHDSWKSAMRNDWLPQHGNPDIGVHRLLSSFFAGPDSKLSDRTCFMDKAGDPRPRFELAVRDLITLFSQCQLTKPIMEALVSTYCSINYTTDRGHVAVPKHMNEVYAAARDQIFQGLAQRGRLPFRPEEGVVNVYGVANEGSGHWIAFHIDRDQKMVKVVDSMMPQREDGRRDTTNRMKTFLDRMVSVEGAHASWLSTLGQWQVNWADEAYQQQNSDDGSIHALQNFADLMHRGEMKRFHDADIIRQRLGLRLNRNLAEGADSWAVVNPFEDELHELWKDRRPTVKRESGTVIKTEPVE